MTRRRVGAVFVSAVAALVACGPGPQSVLAPAAEHAAAVETLWWFFFIVAVAVFLVVTALLLYGAVWAPREGAGERARRDRKKVVAVTVGAVGTGAVLLAILLVDLTASREAPATAPAAVVIEVTGHRFWWEVRYLDSAGTAIAATANEIHLPTGRRAEIRVRTADVIHSFWVPNLHGKIDMVPGRVNTIAVHPTEPGTFRGQCAEFCGVQHALMAFMVVVEPPERFASWLRELATPAPPPTDPAAVRGQEVFLSAGCGECHTVRGTPADGIVGPELTHVSRRLTLAAGTLPNTRGHMAGWLADPQAVKPGNNMPTIPLEPRALRDLLDYLATLR